MPMREYSDLAALEGRPGVCTSQLITCCQHVSEHGPCVQWAAGRGRLRRSDPTGIAWYASAALIRQLLLRRPASRGQPTDTKHAVAQRAFENGGLFVTSAYCQREIRWSDAPACWRWEGPPKVQSCLQLPAARLPSSPDQCMWQAHHHTHRNLSMTLHS
jgi:hypothetical protein